MEISCIILAGGKSVRYGHNKVLEKLGKRSLLEQVISRIDPISEKIIIVTIKERPFAQFANNPKVRIVNDIVPGMGSLGGIYTGLVESETFYNLVVAADMPFLNESLLRYMVKVAEGNDLTLPRVDKWYEPLHAIYSKNCTSPAKAILDQGKKVIIELFNHVKVRYVDAEEIDRFDPQHLSFFNINTQEDMERAIRITGGNTI